MNYFDSDGNIYSRPPQKQYSTEDPSPSTSAVLLIVLIITVPSAVLLGIALAVKGLF